MVTINNPKQSLDALDLTNTAAGLSQRPRVAFYMRLLYGGGAERVVVNLMAGMVERGIAVDLVLNTVSGPFMSQVPTAVNVVDLSAPRMVEGLPKLANYLKTVQPDALITGLHYNSEISLWARAWARLQGNRKTKVLVIEHNTLSIHSQRRRTDRWAPLLSRLFYPWADRLVAVSQGAASDLAEVTKQSQDEIDVIYNPVITPSLEAQAAESLDHPWFQPGEPPVVLGIGRLEPQKDFATLVRAFAKLRQQQDCRLVLLGAGQQHVELENLSKQLGIKDSVKLLGFVENPHRYLARAGVFVLSSAWEGLSNVLIEAIALGIPAVSTDCPCGPSEVVDGGKYGRLVPVGDVEAMALAMAESLRSPRNPAPAEWLQQFTVDAATEQYLKLLAVEYSNK